MRAQENRHERDKRVRGAAAATVVATALASLALLLSPWFAGAGHLAVPDGRDTDGRLDIRRADVFGDERPRWKVATYGSWTARDIWDKGYVLVWLDTFGDDRFDYYALVRSTGSRLRAELWRDRLNKKDRRVATLQVWRKNRRRVSVRVPLGRLNIGAGRLHYTWAVQTLFTGPNCRQTCFDFAPDTGGVPESLPGAEPSPTPTETPTEF